MILEARDPQAKGALERSHRFMRTNFELGRVFANHLDFQDRLDAWTEKAIRRVHRTIRAVPAERLAEERTRMRPLPPGCPTSIVARCCGFQCSRSFGSIATTTRSPRCSPVSVSRFGSRRPRSPRSCSIPESSAARHRRVFAGGLTLTDPANQTRLQRQRERRRQRHQVEVEIDRCRAMTS